MLLPCAMAVGAIFTLACSDQPAPSDTTPPPETPAPPEPPAPPPAPAPPQEPEPAPTDPQVFVGAGDIAGCAPDFQDEATANLLDQIEGTIFALGDNVQGAGDAAEFADCYHPTWGRHKERTRPALGNHEYNVPGALPHFEYWGERAGPAGKGYYSYDLGSWHIVVLNSNTLFDEQNDWRCGGGSRSSLKQAPTSC
jgi:hypothetical protein